MTFLRGFAFAALAVMLSSCSADLPAQRDPLQGLALRPVSPYSIVFVIHGDGDYLYHDTSGTERTADEEALAEAKRIAERNPHAEVFIFHQIPREHFLFFFPVRDGEFYHYRNGLLVGSESYWRDKGESRFEPEAALYRSSRPRGPGAATTLFVYCGHEIPEYGGEGYDGSLPDRKFAVDDLADGLKSFKGDSAKFDLVILSTCFGGTPHTIAALGAYSRYIVASPDNLHLSYFDLHPLERLDEGLKGGDISAFARHFARQSFDRLTGDIQTSVSVAVYEIDSVQGFLRSVRGMYDRNLARVNEATRDSLLAGERCDCAEIPAYALPAMHRGVEVLFRPANFGRSRLKEAHSGWECWKEQETPTARAENPVTGSK